MPYLLPPPPLSLALTISPLVTMTAHFIGLWSRAFPRKDDDFGEVREFLLPHRLEDSNISRVVARECCYSHPTCNFYLGTCYNFNAIGYLVTEAILSWAGHKSRFPLKCPFRPKCPSRRIHFPKRTRFSMSDLPDPLRIYVRWGYALYI